MTLWRNSSVKIIGSRFHEPKLSASLKIVIIWKFWGRKNNQQKPFKILGFEFIKRQFHFDSLWRVKWTRRVYPRCVITVEKFITLFTKRNNSKHFNRRSIRIIINSHRKISNSPIIWGRIKIILLIVDIIYWYWSWKSILTFSPIEISIDQVYCNIKIIISPFYYGRRYFYATIKVLLIYLRSEETTKDKKDANPNQDFWKYWTHLKYSWDPTPFEDQETNDCSRIQTITKLIYWNILRKLLRQL